MFATLRTFVLVTLSAVLLSLPAHAMEKYNILMGGYYDGPSVSGTFGLAEVFTKVPVGFEVDLGYSWTDTGDAIMARKVFINQATTGNDEVQSSGGVLDVGINATYPLARTFKAVKFIVFGGPRYAHYDVRHQYTGGNEDFDIVAHSWGLGGGLRGVLPLSEKFSAVLQLGLDYYFPTSIYGHDATYYPDNHNINARNDGNGYTYTYDDATSCTTVPRLRPRVMLGIQF